jgi:hypothetical protein
MKKLILLLATALTFTTTAFAQIGSADKDLVFTPVAPCRILDTRLMGAGGTPILAGATNNYVAGSVANFTAIGGSATDCGLQAAGLNVAAIAVNFVAVSPSAAGYITVFPYNGVQPTASTVNYTAGAVVANSAIIKVSQASLTAMSIFSLATTHVVADVTGYYSRPVATAVNCTTVSGVATNVAAGTYVSLPTLNCAAGFTPTYLHFSAGENVLMADSYMSGNAAQIFVRSFSANAQSVTGQLRCCQIPGR